MGTQAATPERSRLRWEQPVAAHRAWLRRTLQRLRDDPQAHKGDLLLLGAFYAIVVVVLAICLVLDLSLPAPALLLAIAAVPPVILVGPPLLRCVIPRTIHLRDTRIEVIDNFDRIVLPVDALESYTLCDEGRWRMLWLRRKDGVWAGWAMPASVDGLALEAWMRERGLPAIAFTGMRPADAAT
jgi:hypothetical protein